MKQEMIAWQLHQLGHMQIIYTSLQTAMPLPHRSVFTGHLPFLPPNQQLFLGLCFSDLMACSSTTVPRGLNVTVEH